MERNILHKSAITSLILLGCLFFITGCGKIDDVTSDKVTQKKDFCAEQQAYIDTLLAADPLTPIEGSTSQPKRLLWWKELFIEHNNITEEYFNKHIRVIRANESNGELLVRFAYIVDAFMLAEYNALPLNMEKEEIQQLTSDKNYYTNDEDFYITSIRVRGDLVEPKFSCPEIVQIAQATDQTLEGNVTLFRNEEQSMRRTTDYTPDQNDMVVRFYSERKPCNGRTDTMLSESYNAVYVSVTTGKIVRQSKEGCQLMMQ